ncbi:hypothetical protein [Dactylosporangium sp. CA-139066]|uniref:hypothetical protein n=1 Tax=Dactylosporangium sp. CA-139066 TaxID=3239930 RepID=UPI003D8C5E39
MRSVDAERRRWLRAGACEIAWPIVFGRLTSKVEHRKGHFLCATAVQRLEPECLDSFHNDVDSLIDHLFAHADVPILNLEGWLTMCLQRAVVNGHRLRRYAKGAQQRPRTPLWLQKALGHDPWLIELATAVLEWAGIDATAGAGPWPIMAWAERRAAKTGDHLGGEAAVNRDLAVVLAAMRRRPKYYQQAVEIPLGTKPAPVFAARRTENGSFVEPEPLLLTERYEHDDSVMQELAATALDAIRRRVRRGEDTRAVVAEVLGAVFGAAPAGGEMDAGPCAGVGGPEQAVALIADPVRFDRILAAVHDLLEEEAGA